MTTTSATIRKTEATKTLGGGGEGEGGGGGGSRIAIQSRPEAGNSAGVAAGQLHSRDGCTSTHGILPAPNGGRRIGRGLLRLVVGSGEV